MEAKKTTFGDQSLPIKPSQGTLHYRALSQLLHPPTVLELSPIFFFCGGF